MPKRKASQKIYRSKMVFISDYLQINIIPVRENVRIHTLIVLTHTRLSSLTQPKTHHLPPRHSNLEQMLAC